METTAEMENGFKETELGLIPNDWKIEKLGIVADLTSGGTPSRKVKDYFSGAIPWVKSGELEDNIIFDTEEKITEKGLTNSSAKMFPKDALLVAMYGATVGKTAILGIEASTNQAVCAIFPQTSFLKTDFLRHYLIFARDRLLNARFGGAQPNISQTILKDFSVIIPSLLEQQKIAFVLSNIKRAIEHQNKIIETTENLKKSLMQKLFTEGIGNTEFKTSEIGDIPESWKITNLEDVGTIVTGKTPSTKKKEYFGGKIHFITPGDLGKSKYIYSPARFLTEQGLKVSKALPKDTVLVVCIGSSIGKTGMVYVDKSVTNQQINAVICFDFVDPHYLYHYLTFRSSYIISLRAPTPVPILNKSNFGKAKIILPPEISEQTQISKILNSVDLKVELAQKKKSILQQLFRTMLNKLMTGEIRVNNLDIGVYDAD